MFSRPIKFNTPPIQVKLVTMDAALEARLRLDLGRDRRFALNVVRSGIVAAAALPDVKKNSSILVIDVNPYNQQEITALETLVAISHNDVPVIVMSEDLAGDTARRLLRLQVSDWLPRQADQSDLLQACEQAHCESSKHPRQTISSLVSVPPRASGKMWATEDRASGNSRLQ